MKTHKPKSQSCPKCGAKGDTFGSPHTDRPPEPWDIILCLHCKTPLVLGPKKEFIVATRKLLEQYPSALLAKVITGMIAADTVQKKKDHEDA